MNPLRTRSPGLLALVAMLLLGLVGSARGEHADVAEELERLMAAHGFTMRDADIEATRDFEGRVGGSDLLARLRTLLEDFDHIIIQKPEGGVERVIILGEKAAYAPPQTTLADDAPGDGEAAQEGDAGGEIVLETQRQGNSHAVILSIEGQRGKRVQRVLLLDTGADYVVLPASLIAQLGIAPNKLSTQLVQTANGKVEAQLGKLEAIWLGKRRVEGVDAAFIEDQRLGGKGLLGMSVLGRFKVTIDDDNNRVVLAEK